MAELQYPADLTADLPHPVGINRTYRSGRHGWYKTAPARAWEDASLLALRAAGFRPLPPGEHSIHLDLVLRTRRLDLDAPLKLVIDVVAKALGVDDRCLQELRVQKLVVARPAEQSLEVRVSMARQERAASEIRLATHQGAES